MDRNEGSLDRALRAAVGIALIGLTLAGIIGLWGWIGAVLLVTAAIGWCPLYTVLGVRTCAVKS